ncbi:hypothetical protein DNTS_014620 [Danionella cerebrum]|uniref:Rubicon Homology domain-containing protein n=1 Tax=Danionella cerebrum TaxID=2873325 RepID=A0A553N1C5_9TELE|nr:hypothetical protein DNTS_014620 [Danionella translucida]
MAAQDLPFAHWSMNSNTSDDDNKDALKACDPEVSLDSGLLDVDEQYHLPRSSPVIYRKRQNSNTEKLSGMSKSLQIWKETNNSSEKIEDCDTAKDFLSDNHDSGGSELSRVPLFHSHKMFQESEAKRRPSCDMPAEDGRNSSQPKKQGSFVDIQSCEDPNSLDQENAHFVVVDMVLEVIEAVKWTANLKQININPSKTDSVSSFDSGFVDIYTSKPCPGRYSLASFQSFLQNTRMQYSAECLAQHLVSEFRKQWFPSELLQNHVDFCSALHENERNSNLGSTDTSDNPLRSEVLASQQFLCAGCGTEIEPRYIKKLRYCNYLGRYFCDGCHSGLESVIPSRVLNHWDFTRYPVCHSSRQFLDSIWQKPLFKLTSVANKTYSQPKELQRFIELQEQLISIKRLLSTCRLSFRLFHEFDQLPAHLTEEVQLFSLDDLLRLKKGQLCNKARALLQAAISHIDICELCQAKGFICEFCHEKEVLFPFQRDTCIRCRDCRACFHISCFHQDESCPKCARLQKRKKLLEESL